MGELEMTPSRDLWNHILKIIAQTEADHKNIISIINRDEGIVSLETSNYKLAIEVTDKWLGYNFTLNKNVLGVELSSWADTDNYALDFDTNFTREISNTIITFLTALLGDKIYIGKKDGRAILAIPTGDDRYELTFSPKFLLTKTESKKSREVAEDKDLHPLISSTR